MICYYHSKDLDGICCGAILQKMFPKAEMIGYDYNQPFDLERHRGETVVMADVSLPMEDMFKLAEITDGRFTWIDHHLTQIKEYEERLSRTAEGEKVPVAVLKNGIAACELTWQYYFGPNTAPLPAAVLWLGMYDTWRNQDAERWEDTILPFQYGMRLRCNRLDQFPSGLLNVKIHNQRLTETIFGIIEDGRRVLRYQEQQNEISCRASFVAEFKGYRALCLN